MLAETATECNFTAARQQLNDTIDWIERASRDGASAHAAEKFLQLQAKALNHKLLQGFFDRVGPGYLGPTVTLKEGHVVECWPELQDRRLVTTFGEFTLWRHVYGTRPGQKIELAPTDQRLQLPQGEMSYLLQEWDQRLGIENAFGKVTQDLEDMMEIKQPMDTLERGSRKMAGPHRRFGRRSRHLTPRPRGSCWWRARTTRAWRWSGPSKPPRPAPRARRRKGPTRSRWRASALFIR